jgi:hypothetical protein
LVISASRAQTRGGAADLHRGELEADWTRAKEGGTPELGTVAWPNGADLDPLVLHGDFEPATSRSDRQAGEILVCLRDEGFSKVGCIQAAVEILRLPLVDAKRLVHESRAWADRREPDDQFHEVLEVVFRAGVSGA